MASRFLLETLLLLVTAQGILGAVGYLIRDWFWLGLPLLPALVWLVIRVAAVFRDELNRAQKKGADIDPVRLTVFMALLWQMPALVGAPLWAPAWATGIWQGAVSPVTALLGLEDSPWLWLGTVIQAALFVWAVLRPQPKREQRLVPSDMYSKVSGEWAVARRAEDVLTEKGAKKALKTKE